MKNEFTNPENVKNINRVGKYDKILENRRKISNETPDQQVGV